MPQGLTRLGSVTAATPGKSDTRLVCRTVPVALGGAAAPAPSGIKKTAATSASPPKSRVGSRLKLDDCWLSFIVDLRAVVPHGEQVGADHAGVARVANGVGTDCGMN